LIEMALEVAVEMASERAASIALELGAFYAAGLRGAASSVVLVGVRARAGMTYW